MTGFTLALPVKVLNSTPSIHTDKPYLHNVKVKFNSVYIIEHSNENLQQSTLNRFEYNKVRHGDKVTRYL